MSITTAALPTSLLALVTMVHVALLVLRKHRLAAAAQLPWALLPSAALCAAPWVFPAPLSVAAGVGAHLVWFGACEWLIPPAPPAAPSALALPQQPIPPPLGAAGHAHPATAAGRTREFVPVFVLASIDESPSIRTFRLERPASFDFEAGQFLTLRVQVDGAPQVRCYSISSAPETTGYLEISVKRQGLVSGTLHATLRQGSRAWVKPPAGRFVYPASDDRPLVLVAGGVGITPLLSMARHAVAADPGRPVTLIYSARTEEELAFREELDWMTSRHPQFRVVPTVTGGHAAWTGHRGRVSPALLAEHVPDAAHAIAMLCGPGEMVADLRDMLRGAGVPDAQVRFEIFQQKSAIGAAAQPAEPASAPTLTLSRTRRTVRVASGQTLLDAAEGAGAPIPSLCRAGVCGTCRTRLLAGDAPCASDALDARDREAGYVLPCVTWARGDCTLEA
jgi:ferredoxin-NADP reductase